MPRKTPKPQPKPKKKPRPLGRKPDAFSNEQITQLETMITNCVSTKAACEALGIEMRTVYTWLEKGEDPKSPKCYAQFRQRIMRARGLAKANGIKVLTDAAKGTADRPGDWRAHAWLLERMYPDDFRPPDKIQHEVKGAIQHDHTHKQIVVVMPAAIATPRPIRQIEARTTPENPPA